jgi:hypothetical protein
MPRSKSASTGNGFYHSITSAALPAPARRDAAGGAAAKSDAVIERGVQRVKKSHQPSFLAIDLGADGIAVNSDAIGFERRCARQCDRPAGCNLKGAAVEGAFNDATIEETFAQRAGAVRTGIVRSVELSFHTIDRNRRPSMDIDTLYFAICELPYPAEHDRSSLCHDIGPFCAAAQIAMAMPPIPVNHSGMAS